MKNNTHNYRLHYPDGMALHGINACAYHGFQKYDWRTDRNEPTLWWCYFEDDYKLLGQHNGKKIVFWHNSDIKVNVQGQGLQYRPELMKYYQLVKNPDVVNVVHNQCLRDDLALIGIHAIIRPVFWGDVEKYKPSEKLTRDVYMSCNKGRGIEYGELIFHSLAGAFPDWNFHIFGIDPSNSVYTDNLKYYGWISESEMDETVKDFGICLRYNLHDGSANTILKALLMEQYCITTIDYQGMTNECRSYGDIIRIIEDIDKQMYPVEVDMHLVRPQVEDVKAVINQFDFL